MFSIRKGHWKAMKRLPQCLLRAASAGCFSCQAMQPRCSSTSSYSLCSISSSTNHSAYYAQTRSVGTQGNNEKTDTNAFISSESKPNKEGVPSTATGSASTPEYLGIVRVSASNITEEMNSKVPLFLYFMVENHPEVAEYTQLLSQQVDQANRRWKTTTTNLAERYGEHGKDAGLAVKLCIVDCLKDPGLTAKFAVDPRMFPIMYFVRLKMIVDKLVGIVPESQVKEAVEAFIDYAIEESKKEAEGTASTATAKLHRQDNDDENAMTLLRVAAGKLRENDVAKAKALFEKSLALSMADMAIVNKHHGVGRKKMDHAMWTALKREACYNSAPQALSGLAMCEMALGCQPKASEIVARIRQDFPFAVKDLRQVAETVVLVELLDLTNYDIGKDSYMTLMRYEELTPDAEDFYKKKLKLVTAFMLDKAPDKAIEECLKIIRAEPKLLATLQAANILPHDFVFTPRAKTPARTILLKIFESLGDTHEAVVKGRQAMQLYI